MITCRGFTLNINQYVLCFKLYHKKCFKYTYIKKGNKRVINVYTKRLFMLYSNYLLKNN